MAEHSKPYDQAFKAMPEADPRGFAELMNLVEPDDPAVVELLPQELSVPTVSMDAGLIVHGERPFIAIFEAFGRWRQRSLDQVMEYAKGADSKYSLPIRVYMVPLVRRALPRNPPRTAWREKGDYEIRVKLRWVRPWEIDAGKLLALERPEFAACTPLFRSTPEQEAEAVDRLRRTRSELARYRILGGLRYREKEAAQWPVFLERMNRMLLREDLRESLAVQEWLEEGRVEGRLEGRQEGLREAHQKAGERFLRRTIARFPGIELPPVLPASLDLVELAEEAMMATDEAAARAVLASHGL